jgi:lambda family phage portal protein
VDVGFDASGCANYISFSSGWTAGNGYSVGDTVYVKGEDIGGVNNGSDERKLTNTDITTEKLSPGQSVYRPGKKMTAVNPTHPNGNFPNFYNCILHQVAAGLMISHATLAGNLEKVNMSSIRAGLLLERAYYMILQNWLRDTLCTPVFSIWLEQAILTGRLPYAHTDLEMYDAPTWQAKRWPWIDPLKDITAFIMLRRARWMSDSQIIAAQGGNFETVRTAIKRDAEYDEKNGTTPPDDAFRAALESLDESQLIRLATSLQESEEPAA